MKESHYDHSSFHLYWRSTHRTLLLLLAIGLSTSITAQEKIERERDIDEEDVPAAAKAWMKDAYERAKKIRWIEEEGADSRSYEAKLKWKGRWHSIEFDTNGTIEDIEIETEYEELPPAVRSSMEGELSQLFSKYSIKKLQTQWTGISEDLEDAVDEGEEEAVTVKYEMEFYGKKTDDNELWEALFDVDGKLLEHRRIIVDPSDNLKY